MTHDKKYLNQTNAVNFFNADADTVLYLHSVNSEYIMKYLD